MTPFPALSSEGGGGAGATSLEGLRQTSVMSVSKDELGQRHYAYARGRRSKASSVIDAIEDGAFSCIKQNINYYLLLFIYY